MTEQEISQIASQVVADTKFWIGLIGVIGAIIGSALTIVGNFALVWFKNKHKRSIDTSRQQILKTMLNTPDYTWRKLSTLSAVVGCNEEQTKDHLIAIGARGSENSDEMWGLISNHPLKSIKR